jgi:hypothetical protein
MYPPHVIWRMHKRHCGLTPEHVDVMATHFKEVREWAGQGPAGLSEGAGSGVQADLWGPSAFAMPVSHH